MKPIFTVHAGEYLVGSEIEKKNRNVNVWIPAKDTGIDLLVSNKDNTKTISLQVKFSKDYLVTNEKDQVILSELSAGGWWTPTRKKIKESKAQYWVFVLFGFEKRSSDFIVIEKDDLLERLDAIHPKTTTKFNLYFWVTRHKPKKCFETRGLDHSENLLIAKKKFENDMRDFTSYLNNWAPIEALED